MRQSLKESVRDKFSDIELSATQLDELTVRTSRKSAGRPLRWQRPAVAAAILLLAVGGMFATRAYDAHRAHLLAESIAREVATNHLRLKPLEVESGELRQVLGYFKDLDFQLQASPKIIGTAGDRLLGGRYCSIQGIDAAQLRVMAADGTLTTWYEATLPDDELRLVPNVVEGDQPASFVVRGVAVRVWQEHGIVFAEAREASGR